MLEKKIEIPLGGNFDPIPMDKYTVQCVDVNLVKQQKFQSTEDEEVLNYKFAILDDKPMEVTEEDGSKKDGSTRGRFLWKRCRLALGDKAWLRKLANAAFGRTLTNDELKTFDPESIVGKQVDVMVEQTEKEQKVYVNIVSFGKTIKPLKPMDDADLKKTGQTVQKETAPAVAPDADEEADKLISKVNEEKEEVKTETEQSDEESPEVLELQLKLAKAKAKEAAAKK